MRAESYEASPQAVSYTALKGNYSYFGTSYYGYYLIEGTLAFDGKGHVSGTMDFNYCVGMTLNGTYSVNPGLASGSTTMTLTSVNTNGCALSGGKGVRCGPAQLGHRAGPRPTVPWDGTSGLAERRDSYTRLIWSELQ